MLGGRYYPMGVFTPVYPTTKKSWKCKFPKFLYREKQSKKILKSGKILTILMPEYELR